MSYEQQHHNAIYLNNHGVSCLQNGEYTNAIKSLSTAFHLLKAAFDSSTCVNDSQSFGLDHYFAMSQDPDEGADGNHGDFVYRQAIGVPPCHLHSPSYKSKVMVTTIVLFNLGLTNHLCGAAHRQEEDSSPKKMHFLGVAKRLYESSYKVQQRYKTQAAPVCYFPWQSSTTWDKYICCFTKKRTL